MSDIFREISEEDEEEEQHKKDIRSDYIAAFIAFGSIALVIGIGTWLVNAYLP